MIILESVQLAETAWKFLASFWMLFVASPNFLPAINA